LKLSKKEKIVFLICVVFGMLLIFQAQPVSANSDLPDSRNYLVDDGEILEEGSTLDHEFTFSSLDTPYGGVEPNSDTVLPDIRVMPLGDSITKGTGTCQEGSPPDPPDEIYWNCTGYRDYLWYSLSGTGHSFNFVGSQGGQFQDDYMNPYHDNDHEGHGGWKAADIKNNIYGSGLNWLQNYPAEIILLHIGTNDIGGISPPNENQKISAVVDTVEQILNKIDQFEIDNDRKVLVVLARIINRIDPDGDEELYTTIFNQNLQDMANTRIGGGDEIVVVDMESALIYPDDLVDGLHPTSIGYSKMAAVWYSAIVDALNFPPTLTNPGMKFSLQGQTISLQMQATDPESDSLTYSAAGLPTGLTINPNSGEISGKVSISIPSGTNFPVTITADDKKGFPYTNPYNKDEVTFDWKIGGQVILPLVIRN
jgi:hypothetical protein